MQLISTSSGHIRATVYAPWFRRLLTRLDIVEILKLDIFLIAVESPACLERVGRMVDKSMRVFQSVIKAISVAQRSIRDCLEPLWSINNPLPDCVCKLCYGDKVAYVEANAHRSFECSTIIGT